MLNEAISKLVVFILSVILMMGFGAVVYHQFTKAKVVKLAQQVTELTDENKVLQDQYSIAIKSDAFKLKVVTDKIDASAEGDKKIKTAVSKLTPIRPRHVALVPTVVENGSVKTVVATGDQNNDPLNLLPADRIENVPVTDLAERDVDRQMSQENIDLIHEIFTIVNTGEPQ